MGERFPDVDGVDSQHYLATGYRRHFERDDPEIVGDDQHGPFQMFRRAFDGFRTYLERYLDAL